MSRAFLLVMSILSMALSTASFAQDQIKDTIIELEQACLLGEDELELFTAIEAMDEIAVENHRHTMAQLLQKLHSCKARLLSTYDSCDVLSQELDDDETPPSIFSRLATGCDWVIRIAGIIWSAQIFYTMAF